MGSQGAVSAQWTKGQGLVWRVVVCGVTMCSVGGGVAPTRAGNAQFDADACRDDPSCNVKFAFGDSPPRGGCRTETLRCTHVYDASCQHRFRNSFFHRLLDCLLPSYPVIEAFVDRVQSLPRSEHPTACIVLHTSTNSTPYTDIVQPFLPARDTLNQSVVWDDAWLSRDATRNALDRDRPTCFQLAPAAQVVRWTEFSSNFKLRGCSAAETASSDRMATVFAPSLADHPLAPKPSILLIQRAEGSERYFQDFPDTLLYFQHRFPAADVAVYWGNESFPATARLFAAADVVVGYHGAGLANSLFLRKGALVIEVTTTLQYRRESAWLIETSRDRRKRQIWRTNRQLAPCRSLDWRILGLPQAQLGIQKEVLRHLQAGRAKPRGHNGHRPVSLNTVLKKASRIRLTPRDLVLIGDVVESKISI